MSYRKSFLVEPGQKLRLSQIDPSSKEKHETSETVAAELEAFRQKLTRLQALLYAAHKHSLLIVLKAMDAGGVVDAGLKALAFDSDPPLVCDEPAATYERASDEHGRLALSAATNRLALGDKIRLIPGHCDPTVNLYDWYVCIRNNRVEQLWPITARGAVY